MGVEVFSLICGPGSCGKSLYALRSAALSGVPTAYLGADVGKAVAQRLEAVQALNVGHLDAELYDLADPRDAVRLECHLVVDGAKLLILDVDQPIGVGHPREPVGALHMLLALVDRLHGLGIDVTLVQRGDPAHCHPDLIAALTSITTISITTATVPSVVTVTTDDHTDYYALIPTGHAATLQPTGEPPPIPRYRIANKRKPPQIANLAATWAST